MAQPGRHHQWPARAPWRGGRCGGDGVLGGELDDGGQLVAGLELAGLDLGSQVGRDGLVGSPRLPRSRLGGGDDLGDGLGCLAVGVLDPGGVDLEGGGAAAAVPEPPGDGAQVDAGG
jgi:hypothetical protein